MAGEILIYSGIFVIIIGFMLITISIIMNTLEYSEKKENHYRKNTVEQRRQHPDIYEKPDSKFKGGGVIMIGPIPIVFGSDSQSVQKLMILAIVLMLIGFVFMLVYSL